MSFIPRTVLRIAALLLATVGCFSDPTTPVRVVPVIATLAITPGEPASLALGGSLVLLADARDSAGTSIQAPVSWSSSAPSIVALHNAQSTSTQVVRAIARAVGSATITVSGGSRSATLQVVVRAPGPVATIEVTSGRSIALGNTLQITVSQRDSNGVRLASALPVFTSSDSTVLRVSDTGLATPVAQGTAIVSATNNGQVGSVTISVTAGARAFLWTAMAGMVDLGVLPGFAVSKAFAVSAAGHIAGTVTTAGASLTHAFVRAPGVSSTMRDLGALTDGGQSGATGVNRAGQVVGYATTVGGATHAVLWNADGAIQDIGTLPGDTHSEARAINDSGQVVGWSGRGPNIKPFIWTVADGMRRIPGLQEGDAFAINSAGVVAGQSSGRPFVWSALGGFRSLPMITGDSAGSAFAINSLGETVGMSIGCDVPIYYYDDCNDAVEHPLFWPAVGGIIQLRNSAGVGTSSGHLFVRVLGINSSGQMVGISADLRALLRDERGGTSRALGVLPKRIESTAAAINDLGHVVGWSGNP